MQDLAVKIARLDEKVSSIESNQRVVLHKLDAILECQSDQAVLIQRNKNGVDSALRGVADVKSFWIKLAVSVLGVGGVLGGVLVVLLK